MVGKQVQLAEHEHELIEMNSNTEKLIQTYDELLEFKMVLQKVVSRLAELEATLDAGICHRNKALSDIAFNLTKWMNLVQQESSGNDRSNESGYTGPSTSASRVN